MTQLPDVFTSGPDDPRVKPVDLHLDRKAGLHIRWADGLESLLPPHLLRKECPCATCRAERAAHTPQQGQGLSLNILPAGVEKATQIVDGALVGSYAMQITWGDGHNTGIYDFRFLRSLANEKA